MAITYPLSLPLRPGFASVVLSGNFNVGVSPSPYSAQQQVYEWVANWWEAQCHLPPMIQQDAEKWITFLLSLRGRAGTFLLGDPMYKRNGGNISGNPLHAGTSSQSKTIALKGFTVSKTKVLVAGDYIQTGSGVLTRLYKVLTDTDADGSGNCSVDVFPVVREAIAVNDALSVNRCKGTFRLKDNKTDWSVDRAKFYGIQFDAVEAL